MTISPTNKEVSSSVWAPLFLMAGLLISSLPCPSNAQQAIKEYVPSPLTPPATIRVARFATVAEAPIVIAEKRGYFAAEGVQLNSIITRNTTDQILAMASGHIDAATLSPTPALFNAVARGIDIKLVAGSGILAPGHDNSGIIIRKDLLDAGRYTGPQSLKGMRISSGDPYSPAAFALRTLLEKVNLKISDVELVIIPAPPETVLALKNKSVDAATTYEPFLSLAEQQEAGRVVLRSLDIASNLQSPTMTVFSREFSENKEVSIRYLTAWLRGARDYIREIDNKEKRTALLTLLKEGGVPVNPDSPAQLMTFDPNGIYRGRQGLTDMLAWMRAEGQVKGTIDLDMLIRSELIEAAANRLPPF